METSTAVRRRRVLKKTGMGWPATLELGFVAGYRANRTFFGTLLGAGPGSFSGWLSIGSVMLVSEVPCPELAGFEPDERTRR